MLLLLTLAGAGAGGMFAQRVRLPGGPIVGAMLGAGAISLTVGTVEVPLVGRLAIFTGLGTMLGMLVTRETLRSLRLALLPALFAAITIIAGGIGVAFLFRALGIAPEGDMLATSPGALSVLVAAAVENDANAPTVALFHVTRLVLVIVTLPLIVHLLPAQREARSARGAAPLFSRAPSDGVATEPENDDESNGEGDEVGGVDEVDVEAGDGADDGEASDEADDGADDAGDRRADDGSSAYSDPTHDEPIPDEGRDGPEHSVWVQLTFTVMAATVGAIVSQFLPIPGTLLLCTTAAGALVTLTYERPHRSPYAFRMPVQIGLGWTIGVLFTPETIGGLAQMVGPAGLAAILTIANGILIALVLRWVGHAPAGDVLATSPGAANAVTATAIEYDASPVIVALYHTVRLLLVILLLPLQVALML